MGFWEALNIDDKFNEDNPTYIYLKPGKYTISAIVTLLNGEQRFFEQELILYE